jgi:hypothetical protein
MKAAVDGMPVCEDTARGLGVRVAGPGGRGDIVVRPDGSVSPETGGMSVTPDDPLRMNALRRPRALGGVGKDPLFVTGTPALGEDLAVRRDPGDPGRHAFVEPARQMSLAAYRGALVASRSGWSLAWA